MYICEHIDLAAQATTTYTAAKGLEPSSPGVKNDDGVVICYVHTEKCGAMRG